jgi:hypothetical protein
MSKQFNVARAVSKAVRPETGNPFLTETALRALSPSGYYLTTYAPLVDNLDLLIGEGEIQFSRASSGTFVDPRSGLIKYSPGGSVTNLLTYSEQFDNAAWNGSTTVTANQTTSPDGVVTADLLIPAAGTNVAGVNQVLTPTLDTTYAASIYVKAKEYDECFIQFRSFHAAGWKTVVFDLSTGTITSDNTGGLAHIEPLSDGWYRCSSSITTDQSVSSGVVFGPASGGLINITHNGTDGIYIWGAQLKVGTFANGYVPTTTTSATDTVDGEPRFEANGLLIEGGSENRLPYSQDFDNAAWTKAGTGSVTANATTAPDGSTTADLLTDSDTTGDLYRLEDNYVVLGTSTETSTFSVYLKEGTAPETDIAVYYTAGGTTVTQLATITWATNTIDSNGTMEFIGDGWYRCSVTATNNGTGNISNLTRIYPAGKDVGTTGSVYAWGAQLEEKKAATSYIPTAGAAVTRAGDVCYLPAAGNIPDPATEPYSVSFKANIYAKVVDSAQRPFFIENTEERPLVQNSNDDYWLVYDAGGPLNTGGPNNDGILEPNINRMTFTVGDGVVTMYDHNGSNSKTYTGPTAGTTTIISIGMTYNGANFLHGHIKSLKIFNKALSADEVAAL